MIRIKKCVGAMLLALMLVSWSCGSNSNLIKKNVDSPESITLNRGTTYIPVDSLGLVIYRSEPVLYKAKGKFYLYAYNRPLHSIDVYDLSEKHFVNRIDIFETGPNAINRVYNMYIKSPDSIYVMGAAKLYLIDAAANIRSKHETMFDAVSGTKGGYFHSPNEAYFKIDDKGENLLAFFVHNDTRGKARTKESLSNKILGKYHLEKDSLSFYPVSYSDLIRENNGDYEEIKPNFSFVGNKLYYGFPIESNIYEFDFSTQEIKTYGGRSGYSANTALRTSQNPSYNYRNEGTWFNRVSRYPGKPYFYRTHWGSQDKKLANGDPSDALSKPGYIMFFDEQMNLIEEYEVDETCYLEGSFATDEGVFFWAKDGMDESQMKLCRYSVE